MATITQAVGVTFDPSGTSSPSKIYLAVSGGEPQSSSTTTGWEAVAALLLVVS
jgi:hypothetical protein